MLVPFSLRLFLLPFRWRMALCRPRMYRSDLVLQCVVHQAMTIQCLLLYKFRGDDYGYEPLTAPV